MYFSHCMPGSFIVVSNPQIDISDRVRKFYGYNETLDPDADKILEGKVLCLNPLYEKSFPNKVIYVTSSGSPPDVFGHFMAFGNAVRKHKDIGKKMLPVIGYWGEKGHSASVPAKEVITWADAVLRSKTDTLGEIQDIYHELKSGKVNMADKLAGG